MTSICEAVAADRRLTIRELVERFDELWYGASGLDGRFANVEGTCNSKL